MLWIKIINFIFSIALFVNALLFVPQIYRLLKTKESKNLSLITFAGFLGIQLAAVLYGYVHRDFILLAGFLLSAILCGTVVILITFYRYKMGNRK
jgi:MtN3 and saliva related transmembrane protein